MKKILHTFIFFLLITSLLAQGPTKTFLFVGSYTNGVVDTGIYVFEFDTNSGHLNEVDRIDNIINPSFLGLSPNGKFLYACTETKLATKGSVSAFEIDHKTGKLTFLNKQTAGGRNPVHVSIHKNNKFIVNSNYTDAGISIFKAQKSGFLNPYTQLLTFSGKSIIRKRQEEAHIHSAIFSPNGKFLFAPDLGADLIRVFKFCPSKKIPLVVKDSLTIKTLPGTGPRHFVFHPNKKYAYCIQELSGSVATYSYKKGQLTQIDSDFSYSKHQGTYGSSDIHISPDGKFLYASNRWHNENTISIFKINLLNGSLRLVDHQATFGDHPRSFVIDPSGNFLLVANQATGNIVVFKRNKQTGLLTKTAIEIHLNLPSSLKMRQYKF